MLTIHFFLSFQFIKVAKKPSKMIFFTSHTIHQHLSICAHFAVTRARNFLFLRKRNENEKNEKKNKIVEFIVIVMSCWQVFECNGIISSECAISLEQHYENKNELLHWRCKAQCKLFRICRLDSVCASKYRNSLKIVFHEFGS